MQLLPLSPWREAVDIEAELVVRLRCKATNNRQCAFLMVEMLDASVNQGASVHVVVEVAGGRGGLRGFIPGLGSSDKLISKTLPPNSNHKREAVTHGYNIRRSGWQRRKVATRLSPPSLKPDCGWWARQAYQDASKMNTVMGRVALNRDQCWEPCPSHSSEGPDEFRHPW